MTKHPGASLPAGEENHEQARSAQAVMCAAAAGSSAALSSKEVAAVLGCQVQEVMAWIQAKKLPAVRIGRSTALVMRRDVHIFIEDRFSGR